MHFAGLEIVADVFQHAFAAFGVGITDVIQLQRRRVGLLRLCAVGLDGFFCDCRMAVFAEFVVMGGPFQEKRAIGLSGTVGERFGDDGIAITARVIAEHLALHHREAAIGGVGDGLVAGEAD